MGSTVLVVVVVVVVIIGMRRFLVLLLQLFQSFLLFLQGLQSMIGDNVNRGFGRESNLGHWPSRGHGWYGNGRQVAGRGCPGFVLLNRSAARTEWSCLEIGCDGMLCRCICTVSPRIVLTSKLRGGGLGRRFDCGGRRGWCLLKMGMGLVVVVIGTVVRWLESCTIGTCTTASGAAPTTKGIDKIFLAKQASMFAFGGRNVIF